MPHYILLINWTEQGVRNVKDTIKRAGAVRRLYEQAGGKLQVYYTMGQYDIVALAEAPNDETTMRINLSLAKLGNVRTTTLKAWTEKEAGRVIAKIK
jgi:uncharacterized protein with GYD domain